MINPFRSERIILMIGDDGVVVVPHHIDGEFPFFLPQADKQTIDEAVAYITRFAQARVTLCADNLAQDYRFDDLPRLNYFDRQKVIARRLKLTFPQAKLTCFRLFRSMAQRILMIGVHDSNPVFVWADALSNRLPDIVLLPMEGARVAARLMSQANQAWTMLISQQKSGGFRQIVLHNNDLVFTRLTPKPSGMGGEDINEILAHDIKASLDYLSRLGLHQASDLSVLLLRCGDRQQDSAFTHLGLGEVRWLSPASAARQLGLDLAEDDADDTSDILFAAAILQSTRFRTGLRLPDQKRLWINNQVRQWGWRSAVAMMVLTILNVLWQAGDLASTLYQSQNAAITLNKTHVLLQEARASAAPLTEPLGRMRQALQRKHIYETPQPEPWEALTSLAAGLGTQSHVLRLNWQCENGPSSETMDVQLRTETPDLPDDRASIVAAFAATVKDIAQTAPLFTVSVTKPPYPSLPQESVTASPPTSQDDPAGEIHFTRRAP